MVGLDMLDIQKRLELDLGNGNRQSQSDDHNINPVQSANGVLTNPNCILEVNFVTSDIDPTTTVDEVTRTRR